MKRLIVGLLIACSFTFATAVGVAQAQPGTAACSEAITKVTIASTAKIRADEALKAAQDSLVDLNTQLTAALKLDQTLPTTIALVAKLSGQIATLVNSTIPAAQKAAADLTLALNAAVDIKNKACDTPTITPTVTTTVTPPPVVIRPNVSAGVNTGGE